MQICNPTESKGRGSLTGLQDGDARAALWLWACVLQSHSQMGFILYPEETEGNCLKLVKGMEDGGWGTGDGRGGVMFP